jgi:hypothetical protein
LLITEFIGAGDGHSRDARPLCLPSCRRVRQHCRDLEQQQQRGHERSRTAVNSNRLHKAPLVTVNSNSGGEVVITFALSSEGENGGRNLQLTQNQPEIDSRLDGNGRTVRIR